MSLGASCTRCCRGASTHGAAADFDSDGRELCASVGETAAQGPPPGHVGRTEGERGYSPPMWGGSWPCVEQPLLPCHGNSRGR